MLTCYMIEFVIFPFARPVHGVRVGRECAVVLEVDHGDGGGVVAHEPRDGEAQSRNPCRILMEKILKYRVFKSSNI